MRMCWLAVVALSLAPGTLHGAENVEHGRALFAECSPCHALEAGKNEVGPHLNGLFGRKAASVEGFTYSPALRRSNMVWTAELLDAYLAEPQGGVFRGNRMPFSGMPSAQDRADLIGYLKEATK